MLVIKGRRFIVLFVYLLNQLSFRKCPHDHQLTNKACFSNITVTNISQRFTYKMAAKNGWHRYVTKLCHYHPMYTLFQLPIGNESVPKIITNNTINLFLTAISISVISSHNYFRILFDKIASVYFIRKYIYTVWGNGQPREPALCQLYRHTFVPERQAAGRIHEFALGGPSPLPFLLEVGSPLNQIRGVWERCWVQGAAPAENEFVALWSYEKATGGNHLEYSEVHVLQ